MAFRRRRFRRARRSRTIRRKRIGMRGRRVVRRSARIHNFKRNFVLTDITVAGTNTGHTW